MKSNNILLKTKELIPVIVDFGKATLRKTPEIYKLNEKQRNRYNSRHLYLAFELRNVYGAKTSTATDIYSLGYIYGFVADKENALLQTLQKVMQEPTLAKRITSPDIIR